jgi:AcrR family transcriptional regulator
MMIVCSFANAVRIPNSEKGGKMGTTERKQRQKEIVYESILTAGWKLVKQDGWQGLSIRKVAEAIEYSIPVIYDHFENKEAILAEFTKRGFRLLNTRLREARAQSGSAAENLEAVSLAYWQFAFENQEYYQLMYGLGMPGCDAVNQMTELKEFTEILLDIVSALFPAQYISDQEAFVKMKSLWSMLHGLVSIRMMSNSTMSHAAANIESEEASVDDYNAVLKESVSNFLAGIKAEVPLQ